MSCSDPTTTNSIRSAVSADIAVHPELHWRYLRLLPQHTFVLPNLDGFSHELREQMRQDLFQAEHLLALSTSNPPAINWHPELTNMLPLYTSGDGNCLLHAASLGMWGVHDRELALRRALHETLSDEVGSAPFRQRWLESKMKHADIMQSNNSEAVEWAELVRQSSHVPTRSEYGKDRFEYLEQIHIFVLAHILRRPIIVYADPVVRHAATDQAIYTASDEERIDGIYLPLLWPRNVECHRDPIVMTFHSAHFEIGRAHV